MWSKSPNRNDTDPFKKPYIKFTYNFLMLAYCSIKDHESVFGCLTYY